jgi:hypothetical protein
MLPIVRDCLTIGSFRQTFQAKFPANGRKKMNGLDFDKEENEKRRETAATASRLRSSKDHHSSPSTNL